MFKRILLSILILASVNASAQEVKEQERTSGNMGPRFPEANLAHIGLVNPEPFRDDSLKFGRFSDGNNVGVGELAKRVAFSSHLSVVAALRGPVSGVVSWRPEPEMAWIATRRVVASVQNAQSWRDGAVGKLPGNSMSLTCTSKPEGSIPTTVSARGPKPTLVRSSDENLAPKAFRQSFFDGKIPSSHDDLLGVVAVRDDAGLNPRLVPSILAPRS